MEKSPTDRAVFEVWAEWATTSKLRTNDSLKRNYGLDHKGLRERMIDLYVDVTGRPPEPGELFFKKEQARRTSEFVLGEEGIRVGHLLEELGGAFDRLRSACRERDVTKVQEQIHLGCFNAPVKMYLADLIGRLRRDEFPATFVFDPQMLSRVVNPAEILADSQHHLDYGIISWPQKDPPKGLLQHEMLYQWQMYVIGERVKASGRTGLLTVRELDELRLERGASPFLVSPPYHASRVLFDKALVEVSSPIPASWMTPNPDTFTRYRMAINGLGTAIAPADALPAEAHDDYDWPRLVGDDGEPLAGCYSLCWRLDRGLKLSTDLHTSFVNEVRAAAHDLVGGRPGVVPLP